MGNHSPSQKAFPWISPQHMQASTSWAISKSLLEMSSMKIPAVSEFTTKRSGFLIGFGSSIKSSFSIIKYHQVMTSCKMKYITSTYGKITQPFGHQKTHRKSMKITVIQTHGKSPKIALNGPRRIHGIHLRPRAMPSWRWPSGSARQMICIPRALKMGWF